MGDWLKRKITGIALAALVLAGWWGYDKIRGGGSSSDELDKTPSVVFGGGGGKLVVDISMNSPGYLRTSFSHGKDNESDRLHAFEKLEAGDHLFSIDLSPDLTYGYFELEIPDAKVGDKLQWDVWFEDRKVMSEDETLQQPLGDNQAFFLQLEFGDLDELRRYAR
ncbi:hypothetical protein L0222_05465 [bacterium]|nr:hypothetical protein [bacterium]MCI0603578.1 hypothetical protein [bacterium]